MLWLIRSLLVLCLAGSVCAEPKFVDAADWLESTKTPKTKRMLESVLDMRDKLVAKSGIEIRLLISSDEDLNAFATEYKGEKIVALNIGLLNAFADDRDVIAAVLAHELGHHAKDHIAKSQSTDTALGILGAVVGAVIDARIGTRGGISGIGSDLAGLGADLLSKTFSRDQEREADQVGLQWMTEAGYNPQGAVRLHQKLLAMGGSGGPSFLRTHPTSDERIANIEAFIQENSDAQKHAAASPTALAKSEQQVAKVAPATSTPATQSPVPAAVPSEPLEGFTLEAYAKMVSELSYTNHAAATYKKLGITPEKFKRLNEGFTKRIQQDKGLQLTQRYSNYYLAASLGPYAKYGKDAARAYASNEPLQESAPMTIEKWVEISVQMEKRGLDGHEAAAKVLKPHELTPYDWNVIHHWWNRKIAESAQSGDMAMLTQWNELRKQQFSSQ